jgi:hypothetical protein
MDKMVLMDSLAPQVRTERQAQMALTAQMALMVKTPTLGFR